MKKWFAIAVMVVVVATFGQCQTLYRIPSEPGVVAWELKYEDRPQGGQRKSEIHPSGIRKVAVPDFGRSVDKTHASPTFYKNPTKHYERPEYGVGSKTTDSLGQFHKSYHQQRYHTEKSPVHAYPVYEKPTTVRPSFYKTENFGATVHKNEYARVPNYRPHGYKKIKVVEVKIPYYGHAASPDPYYDH